ncbi:hypothetical protein CDL12_19979 [Handroanthus impetiginosus]|uniref:SANT domain-containing protein n=1 Tax=Handroanthus impetiginosus TaxID=429701 RepID=A0A2G9GQ86_9LAMI|nr:hypothetical protein CDL12_19979 [Handroanthus impetiginosus]
MPTEQLPWDRRDFRRHERSGWDPRFGGGGFGGGGPHRWREQQHHPHTPPHPLSYHHNHNQQQPRWYSDLRSSRPASSGPGKQGGWHAFPDEAGHGFQPFGSRYGDRNLEDDKFRPFGSRCEGRYFRNGRENRGSFTQKDWRSPSWEPTASSSGTGRPITEVNDQKSVENTQTCYNINSKSNESCKPLSDSLSDQSQSLAKEEHEKNNGTTEGLASSGHNSEKENGLGSIDWKPLKWPRSGSLSSRGSGFSNSNSSKSMGVDSIEIVAEVQPKNVTPLQSPGAARVVSSAPAPSEEMSSRKKPRLGWGEGLAKYEKKKVEGPEDGAAKDGLLVDVTNTETMLFSSVNPLDKSPRVANVLNCASPATPSSVACSSSPGIDEKESIKAANVDCDTAILGCSPSIMFQTHYEGPVFNLENLDLTSIANLSSLINELIQSDDPISVEADYAQTTSMNKLLVWKVDVLKALEVTESEIDFLETELKSLTAVPTSSAPQAECHLEPCEEQVNAASFAVGPAPWQVVSSCDMIIDNRPAALKDGHVASKDDIDSPGSRMSKLVEELPSRKGAFPSDTAECVEVFVNSDLKNSSSLGQTCLENGIRHEGNTRGGDDHKLVRNYKNLASAGSVHHDVDIYETILASNKDSANRALEELNNLLPAKQDLFDTSTASTVSCFQKDASVIKEKFLMKKRSLQFKEKVTTLKFKVFQHFWKQGRVVSVRKLRGKSHKTFDLSRTGYKKNRSSNRSRVSYTAGSLRTVPAEEVIEFVDALLAESPFKPCRDTLKMPALILDKGTKMSRFISRNGLVEDPCAAEKERSMINPWTAEERDIFIDKLAIHGKNFAEIASFLDHKTIADCIEFYYKNHKSECFERARKKPEFAKERKSLSATYLVATGKRRNREAPSASLDILGEASLIVASANDAMEAQQKCTSGIFFGPSSSRKASRGDDDSLRRSNSLDMYSNETLAADVLAGICGSLSSEAMSSCITSSVDPPDGCQEWKCPRVSPCIKLPVTPDVTQNVDDECSDDSCEEMDPTDWTDEEKSVFIDAVSSYGKDFVMISRCVQTRSRDQCRIFFGKARKCLGLDLIQPGACNGVSGHVNGGGSDSEDACVLETGSTFCNGGSEGKTEDGLLPPDAKLSHESDIVGTDDLKPDLKICGESSGACPLDFLSAEPVVKNSSMDDSQVGNNPVTESKEYNDASGTCGPSNMVTSYNTESVRVEQADDHGLPKGSSEADKKALDEVSDELRFEENERQGLTTSQDNLDNKKAEDRDANSSQVSLISSAVSGIQRGPERDGNVSRPSVDANSTMQVESGSGKKAEQETCFAKTSHIIPLPQNAHFSSMESSTLFSVPIKYQTRSSSIVLSTTDANGISGKHTQSICLTGDPQLHLSGFSSSNPVEYSRVLRGYPLSVQTVKETNADVNREKHVPIQHASRRDRHLNSDHRAEFSLQKCTSSRHQSEVVQAEFPSQEQSRDHCISQAGCSPDLDKPSRNGDVKLFGKILISSQEKPSSSVQGTGDDNGQHHKAGCQALNMKLNGDQKVNLDSPKLKFDCNNYPGSENIPVRSFCFSNGNSPQTSFPPLPNPPLLLTKYPAAFSNISMVKLDQQQSHGVVRTNDHRPINGVSIFPSRELSSTDYQVLRNRDLQPFHIDMKQPQDVLFSERQRRNGLDIVSGMQQQSRGMVGINVVGRGGLLVGGQCSGVSDPVSAIKMHYSRSQNHSVQVGNIIREEDTWSNGDVGR